MNRQIVPVSLCVVMGCVPPEPDFADVEQPVINCPPQQCGSDNSPNIRGAYFHELNRFSTATNPIYNTNNPYEQFAFVGLQDSAHNPWAASVSHGRLYATANGTTLSGAQLIGFSLYVMD